MYRCKGAGDSAGQCTGKRRNGPCSDDTPSACLRPQISPTRPAGSLSVLLHRCWITVVRRDLTAAAFPRKPISIPLLPRPRVLKVSFSAQRTTPYCVSSVYHLIRLSFTAPPPASKASRLVCPKSELPAKHVECERIAPEFLGPKRQLSRRTESGSPGGLHRASPPGGLSTSPPSGFQYDSPRRTQAWASEATSPRPFWAAVKTRTGSPQGQVPCSPSRVVHAGGRGCWPKCEVPVDRKLQPLRVGGARETEEGSKGGGGIHGHSRNYFQEEVTCVPSRGTFQIPTPL